MDDQAELDSGLLTPFPTLQRALAAFQTDLFPKWKAADSEAARLQTRHRTVAWWAIVPGVLALVLAIAQLTMPRLLEHPEAILHVLACLEFAAVTTAAVAVVIGFWKNTRDRWLAARQSAERMRMLKFRALTDFDLWNDFEGWQLKWQKELADLEDLKFPAAEDWVHGGSAEPRLIGTPGNAIPSAEIRGIADYYLSKRHWFQKHYFRVKAREHRRDTWLLRLHLPVGLFFASVLLVIAHVLLELYTFVAKYQGHEADHKIEAVVIVCLALAAALPIIGFGFRAWFSAFELPRRAQLFQGKARQITRAIRLATDDRLHARKTFTHIEFGEHFYENEHREWCRLILEAEWFV